MCFNLPYYYGLDHTGGILFTWRYRSSRQGGTEKQIAFESSQRRWQHSLLNETHGWVKGRGIVSFQPKRVVLSEGMMWLGKVLMCQGGLLMIRASFEGSGHHMLRWLHLVGQCQLYCHRMEMLLEVSHCIWNDEQQNLFPGLLFLNLLWAILAITVPFVPSCQILACLCGSTDLNCLIGSGIN